MVHFISKCSLEKAGGGEEAKETRRKTIVFERTPGVGCFLPEVVLSFTTVFRFSFFNERTVSKKDPGASRG